MPVEPVPPRMQAIGDATKAALAGSIPHLAVQVSDSLGSSVTIYGALEPKGQWVNGIFHNANYFIANLTAAKGAKLYDPAINPDVTLEVFSQSHRMTRIRKYTGPSDKAIAKLLAWIELNKLTLAPAKAG